MMGKKPREFQGSNRRKYRRLSAEAASFLKSVAINQGMEAQVIDISNGGILLTTAARLRPQMKIILKIITNKGALKITGIVIRSTITSLDKGPLYKSAIAFETPLTMIDEQEHQPEAATNTLIESAGPGMFSDGREPHASPGPDEEISDDRPEVLTIHVSKGFGDSLNQNLSLNDW